MNLTPEQKKYLVPASLAAAVFVVCDELVFKGKATKGKKGVDNKSLLAAAATAVSVYVTYDKATAATKAQLDEVAIPTGAAAVSFAAINRFAAPLFPSAKTDRRPFALGAAAVGAFLAHKATDPTPTVGMLPERTFEPPFPPPFGPNFPPEFEG